MQPSEYEHMNKNTKKTKNTSVKPVAAPAPVAPAAVTPTKPATPPAAPAPPVPAAAAAPLPAPPKPAKTLPLTPPRENHVLLEFTKPEAHKVFVAGSFNEWKPESTPLRQIGNGRWVGDLKVKPGRHEYLFVVDGQWVPDPNAKETVANPYGGTNSVLIVSE